MFTPQDFFRVSWAFSHLYHERVKVAVAIITKTNHKFLLNYGQKHYTRYHLKHVNCYCLSFNLLSERRERLCFSGEYFQLSFTPLRKE